MITSITVSLDALVLFFFLTLIVLVIVSSCLYYVELDGSRYVNGVLWRNINEELLLFASSAINNGTN